MCQPLRFNQKKKTLRNLKLKMRKHRNNQQQRMEQQQVLIWKIFYINSIAMIKRIMCSFASLDMAETILFYADNILTTGTQSF